LDIEIELLAGIESLAGNVEGNFGGAEGPCKGGGLVPAECITTTNLNRNHHHHQKRSMIKA
jgi:hypothetical protein